MAEPITVTQLNTRISSVLTNTDGLNDITVVGELSEYKPAPSGHIYPTLKDGNSVLKCTFFRSAVSTLKFIPKVGMKVIVFGSVSYYSPSGSLTFNIRKMIEYGEGEQKKALDELKLRLLEEGLFSPERKRVLPKYPKVVGVVTSKTGAVIKDIIDTAARRFPTEILLAPAKVQGDGSDISIVKGIELLNCIGVDVIIVGRGGGSADDLSAFNSEIVVRAIASSKAPVISAVGHATDKSLTDLVADRYAETPTAAATFATAELATVDGQISGLELRMANALSSKVDKMKLRFKDVDSVLDLKVLMNKLDRYFLNVETLNKTMNSSLNSYLINMKSDFNQISSKLDPKIALSKIEGLIYKLDMTTERINNSIEKKMTFFVNNLSIIDQRLNSDNPYNVLNRGYSYITDEKGTAITSVNSFEKGNNITIRMRDGRAIAEIKEVNK